MRNATRSIFAFTCLLLLTTTAAAQTYKPAIEFESLMSIRFYEANGGFLVEGLEVVFPPAGNEPATFIITKPGGEVVASVPLRSEQLEGFPAFAMFRPAAGNPGNVRVAQSGDFVMAVKIGNETITKLPFSFKGASQQRPLRSRQNICARRSVERPGLPGSDSRRPGSSSAVQLVDEHA